MMKNLIKRLHLMEIMERGNPIHAEIVEGIRVLEERQKHVDAGTKALYDTLFGNRESEDSANTRDKMSTVLEVTTIRVQVEKITTFYTFGEWVNKAASRIGGLPPSERVICVASDNSYCHIGADFMHARDNDLFPVHAYRLVRTSNYQPDSIT